MEHITGIERAAIEARARRLATAVIAVHSDLDQLERAYAAGVPLEGEQVTEIRRELLDRVQDLVVMSELLPRPDAMRLAVDHVRSTLAEWAAEPLGTEGARAGSLSMVIAMALLGRTLADDARAHRLAA